VDLHARQLRCHKQNPAAWRHKKTQNHRHAAPSPERELKDKIVATPFFEELNVKDLLYLLDLLAADGTSLRGGTQWFVKKFILTVVLGMAHCRG